jgi:hypothetical protein
VIGVVLTAALVAGCGGTANPTPSKQGATGGTTSAASGSTGISRAQASTTPQPVGSTAATHSAGPHAQPPVSAGRPSARVARELRTLALRCATAPLVSPPGPPGSSAFTRFVADVVTRAKVLNAIFGGELAPSAASSAALHKRLMSLYTALTNASHLALGAEHASDPGALYETLTDAVVAVDARAHEADIPGCGMLVLAG